MDHYEDYFEFTGQTLLGVSDEVIESVHSRLRQFEESHRYKVNKKGSESHRKKQHKSVVLLQQPQYW